MSGQPNRAAITRAIERGGLPRQEADRAVRLVGGRSSAAPYELEPAGWAPPPRAVGPHPLTVYDGPADEAIRNPGRYVRINDHGGKTVKQWRQALANRGVELHTRDKGRALWAFAPPLDRTLR